MSKHSLPLCSSAFYKNSRSYESYTSGEQSKRRIRHSNPDQAVRPRGFLRALIVDDCASNRLLYCHFLRKLGYSIRSTATGEEAVELCKGRKFDLILMDVSLPGMNGIEASKLINAEQITDHETQIVFCTGYSNCEIEIPEGIYSMLLKPFTRQKLFEHLSCLNVRKS